MFHVDDVRECTEIVLSKDSKEIVSYTQLQISTRVLEANRMVCQRLSTSFMRCRTSVIRLVEFRDLMHLITSTTPILFNLTNDESSGDEHVML